MQLDIRKITTTVRPLANGGGDAARVDTEELARLVAAELARADASAAGRSLRCDDPVGELHGVNRRA